MSGDFRDAAEIAAALDDSRLWFVVGLGNNPDRPAYEVARVLMEHGKTIVPIHPRAEQVHGEQGYASIEEAAAVHGTPDVVDVFVRSDQAGAIADQAVAAGAGAVWFQLGVIDEEAAHRVRAAGRAMIMDACPAIEWRRRLSLG